MNINKLLSNRVRNIKTNPFISDLEKKLALCPKALTPASVLPDPLILICDFKVFVNAFSIKDWIEVPFF